MMSVILCGCSSNFPCFMSSQQLLDGDQPTNDFCLFLFFPWAWPLLFRFMTMTTSLHIIIIGTVTRDHGKFIINSPTYRKLLSPLLLSLLQWWWGGSLMLFSTLQMNNSVTNSEIVQRCQRTNCLTCSFWIVWFFFSGQMFDLKIQLDPKLVLCSTVC